MYVFQEDDSGTTTPSSTHSRTPIAGHVSSLRSPSESVRKITTNIKDASKKHIDPRTGNIEQGPSRMGFDSSQNVCAKESSTDESSPRNTQGTSRAESNTNRSFRGKRENITNVHNSVSSNRTNNEPYGSSQHLRQQSNKESFSMNPIMDSGYGSLDKLKMDGNSQMRSPVLTRRLSNKLTKNTVDPTGNSFDSEDGRSDERGSSGFVNTMGLPLSMKDTAYDYVRIKK